MNLSENFCFYSKDNKRYVTLDLKNNPIKDYEDFKFKWLKEAIQLSDLCSENYPFVPDEEEDFPDFDEYFPGGEEE